VLVLAREWLDAADVRIRAVQHYGPLPEPEANWWERPSGPAWLWWMAAVMPLGQKAQVRNEAFLRQI